jgi:ribosome-associated heat shock protein Hsp15
MTLLPESHIRLDKWLKIARIFKTRTQAGHACEAGRVKVNGAVAKAAKTIKKGDALTVKHTSRYRELEVLDISFKSISAKEARELYREEKSQSISEESLDFLKLLKGSKQAKTLKYPGRPTKKERRTLVKIRGR